MDANAAMMKREMGGPVWLSEAGPCPSLTGPPRPPASLTDEIRWLMARGGPAVDTSAASSAPCAGEMFVSFSMADIIARLACRLRFFLIFRLEIFGES